MLTALFLVCFLSVASLCYASPFRQPQTRNSGTFLKLDLVKQQVPARNDTAIANSLRRRGDIDTVLVNGEATNTFGIWSTTLTLGTLPQTIVTRFDTGSSDLVVRYPFNTSDTSGVLDTDYQEQWGFYDPTLSTSWNMQYPGGFYISYDGGEYAGGDYGSETLTLGGATVVNLTIAAAEQGSYLNKNIFGVGFTVEEARTYYGTPYTQYDNFPVLLVKQGLIASRAYSLWVNDDQATSGTVLFGAIDSAKYYDELITVPLVASCASCVIHKGVIDFTVIMTGITITDPDHGVSSESAAYTSAAPPPVYQYQALFDSGGGQYTFLLKFLTLQIWDYFGATASPDYPDFALIDCGKAVEFANATLNFHFGDATIHVHVPQLIFAENPIEDGQTLCNFAISSYPLLGNVASIGDTFMSSAYIVFDLDNKQLAMADAVLNINDENIVDIGTGPNAIPSVQGVPRTKIVSTSSSSTTSSSTSTATDSTTSTTTASTTITTIDSITTSATIDYTTSTTTDSATSSTTSDSTTSTTIDSATSSTTTDSTTSTTTDSTTSTTSTTTDSTTSSTTTDSTTSTNIDSTTFTTTDSTTSATTDFSTATTTDSATSSTSDPATSTTTDSTTSTTVDSTTSTTTDSTSTTTTSFTSSSTSTASTLSSSPSSTTSSSTSSVVPTTTSSKSSTKTTTTLKTTTTTTTIKLTTTKTSTTATTITKTTTRSTTTTKKTTTKTTTTTSTTSHYPTITTTLGYPLSGTTQTTTFQFPSNSVGLIIVNTPSSYSAGTAAPGITKYITHTVSVPIKGKNLRTINPSGSHTVGVVYVFTSAL